MPLNLNFKLFSENLWSFISDSNDHNKYELDKAKQKLDESFENIRKLDISEIFSSLYNNYIEYLDSLTSDKIVCLFNIILDNRMMT